MSPLKAFSSVFFLGVLVVGGYWIKLVLERVFPYTLVHVDKYKKGGENEDKFGGKFAPYLISNEEEHKEHNRLNWEINISQLLRKNPTPVTGGFFDDEFKNKKNTYNSATESEKKEKFKELIDVFIKVCADKYDGKFDIEEKDKPKWQEYWTYCSIDGQDRTSLQITSKIGA